MALESLSPEVAYCLKDNIAYPIVGAASLAVKAEARIEDAATSSNGAQTQHITAITVPAQVNVNQ
jgi:hypothetical protein